MKKIRKVRYTGILAEPMVLQKTYIGLLTPTEQEEKIKEWDEKANNLQHRMRVLALFEHYRLNPLSHEDWRRIVGALASDHVPGFQIIDGPAPRTGRPSKWQGDKSLELLADVWALEARDKSAYNACKILMKKPKYRKLLNRPPDKKNDEEDEKRALKTLYRRYQEALKNCTPFMAKFIHALKEDDAPYKDLVIHSWSTDEDARKCAGERLNLSTNS